MLTPAHFRHLALSLPNAVERPHADRTKFRARIDFASLHEPSGIANLMLKAAEQAAFSAEYPAFVHPVPGGFGRMGWTTVELAKADEAVVWAILLAAYEGAL